jgi:hypothetical protein
MPTLPPTNVGLIGALHEGGERERSGGPTSRGGRQYRERPDYKFFHSGGRLGVDQKAPAPSVFSVLTTAFVPCFSTGVEEIGEVS